MGCIVKEVAMKKIQFNINGMTCTAPAPVPSNERSGKSMVLNLRSLIFKWKLVVQHDRDLAPASLIISTIVALGYGAELADQNKAARINKETGKPGYQSQIDAVKFRLIASLIFLHCPWFLAMGPMIGLPIPIFLAGEQNILINALTQMLLTCQSFTCARHFYINGFKVTG